MDGETTAPEQRGYRDPQSAYRWLLAALVAHGTTQALWFLWMLGLRGSPAGRAET